jgi:hypothetical protein
MAASQDAGIRVCGRLQRCASVRPRAGRGCGVWRTLGPLTGASPFFPPVAGGGARRVCLVCEQLQSPSGGTGRRLWGVRLFDEVRRLGAKARADAARKRSSEPSKRALWKVFSVQQFR